MWSARADADTDADSNTDTDAGWESAWNDWYFGYPALSWGCHGDLRY
ncbi:MAG: hypothetical protein LC776_17515 [Acidobacteria bacterium]|nr:hypothetical protein [Acidobacteriota bacterium]